MTKTIRRHAAGFAVSALLCLAGCASFPAASLKDSRIPSAASYQHKPKVYLDVKFFQGDPDQGRAVELPTLEAKVRPIVEKVAADSGLFAGTTFDAFEQGKVDQTVQLYFYNYGDAGAATLAGLLCGFTFGVIPAAATDNYALISKATAKGAAVNALRSNDSVTTWIGIWFLPFAGKTPAKAVDATFEDLVRDAFRQLVESRQLQISRAPEYLFFRNV